MDFIDSILLGILQGLTEFLPISSSGHLVLAKAWLSKSLQQDITFEVVVHFGTLCSIFIYYRERLSQIISSLWSLAKQPGQFGNKIKSDQNIQLSGYILISMIPALIVGLTLEQAIERHMLNPVVVSIMLLVTGSILFATKFRSRFEKSVNVPRSVYIGLAQAFAIIPGISRSGSTISLGLYLGVDREEVANFSFLMVIPVIAGATLLKVTEAVGTGITAGEVLNLLGGFLAAFISGYYALKYLIILLRRKGIHYFAWYCWALGGIGLIYFV